MQDISALTVPLILIASRPAQTSGRRRDWKNDEASWCEVDAVEAQLGDARAR
jgi:hypothetical protein